MIYLYVAAGGAFGALMRYLLGNALVGVLGREFPYGTFVVNVLGSLAMGMAVAWLASMMPRGRELHALVVIGALGGFTTFSAFAHESYALLERGALLPAALYIGGSVVLSILAFFLGMAAVRLVTI